MTRLAHFTVLATAVLVLVAVVFTAEAGAASGRGAALKVAQGSLGRILVDSNGRTLYLFTHDKQRSSTCNGSCARNWPPFTTRGKPRAISGARTGLLRTARRKDGRIQVTYHGHPLYYYAGDKRAGQTRGEGRSAFGGRWYAVSAAGAAVKPIAKPSRFEYAKLAHGVLAIQGTQASDTIALRLQAGKSSVLQVDVGDNGSADAAFPRASISQINVDVRAGDDVVRVDERNGAFTTTIRTTIDGGAGNDAIAGGSGAETLQGGEGNDSLDGNGGNDLGLLGAGDDTFVWDPGDGSDTVEGQDGTDILRFNGAAAAERIDLSANGSRLRLFRDLGMITMDTAGVERVDVNALGGADVVTTNDLSGTGVTVVNADLAGVLGEAAGDGEADRVIVNATNGDDTVNVDGDANAVKVGGLAASVQISHHEAASDRLELNTLAGADSVNAAGLAAGAIQLVIDGGAGDDALAGGKGVETLQGGDGNDSLDGNGGNDLGLLGAGDDTFVWDPGDGSDTVEGEDGADILRFNGSGADERIGLSAEIARFGTRFKLQRDPGMITMDTAGVERVDVNTFGGADVVEAEDLNGTGVDAVNLDLGGDGEVDHVRINGTEGDDAINVAAIATAASVIGLSARVTIQHQEPDDQLEVAGRAGNDNIIAPNVTADVIALTLDGGTGDDELFGGRGNEQLLAGDGDDVVSGFKGDDQVSLGAGDDLFDWDPGDGSDTVDGQDGLDTLSFIGANTAEQVELSADGSHVLFKRDVGGVTMDLAGLEEIDFAALAGADTVTVNDLTGTDLPRLQVDLDGGDNTGDGETDRIVLNGTDGDDTINVKGNAEAVGTGFASRVGILNQEPDRDRLEINTLGGTDTVTTDGLAAGAIQLLVDGVPRL